MEPDRMEGEEFTSALCAVAIATDKETGVSHVAATLPGGTYVLAVESARTLGIRLLEASVAAATMNSAAKGAPN